MRKTGYTKVQIEDIRQVVENSKTILVAGMEDPTLYIKMLKDLGCNAKAEPSYVNRAEEVIYDEISDWQWHKKSERVLTGFIFSKL